MEERKFYRRGAASPRNLPADASSLAEQFQSLHRRIHSVAPQLKRNPHDYKARRRLQILHDQRSRAWETLRELDPARAAALQKQYQLKPTGGGGQ